MKTRRITHTIAILALTLVAAMSMISVVRAPIGSSIERALQPLIGLAIWSLLIWKIWTRLRKWGLGVGIFLLLMIAFQTYLWRRAIADPEFLERGFDASVIGFVLYEGPLAIAGIACILLRFQFPREAEEQRAA